MWKFLTLETIITVCIGVLVVLVAGCAFALSFTNLQTVAEDIGVPHDITWVWPLCLDAFMVVGSLAILLANIKNLSPDAWWVVLIVSTGASTVFNTMNSESVKSVAGHALPPIALCISLEVLMWVIRTCTPYAHSRPSLRSRLCKYVMKLKYHEQTRASYDPVVQYYREYPGTPYQQAAKVLEIHRTSISRRVARAIRDGYLSQDCIPETAKGIDDNSPVG